MGDRHVYGAKSRFLTPGVMACLQEVAFGASESDAAGRKARTTVDVAAQLRGLWA
jgi:hypothetical protein